MDLPSIRGNQNTTKLIQYLKSSEMQYPPLDYDAEREMIEKNKLNRDKLEHLFFMHNIRLVFNAAKKWKYKVNDFDEMVQDSLNGLAEAAKRFDPWTQAHDPITKEPKFMPDGSPAYVKFSTYAVPWIHKMILERFYRKNVEVERNSISLNTPAQVSSSKSDGRETATLEDYVQDYIEPTCYKDNSVSAQLSAEERSAICRKLYSVLDQDTSLSVADKSAFTDLFYNNTPDTIVKKKYRISKSEMASLKHKILKKFKKILEDEYGIKNISELYSV